MAKEVIKYQMEFGKAPLSYDSALREMKLFGPAAMKLKPNEFFELRDIIYSDANLDSALESAEEYLDRKVKGMRSYSEKDAVITNFGPMIKSLNVDNKAIDYGDENMGDEEKTIAKVLVKRLRKNKSKEKKKLSGIKKVSQKKRK